MAMSTSFAATTTATASASSSTFTQELRLQGSAFNGRLDWLVGGYYANEDLAGPRQSEVRHANMARSRPAASSPRSAPIRCSASPTAPGCLGTTPQAALGGATGRQAFGAGLGAAAPVFLAGLDRLSTVNNVGDNTLDLQSRTARNWAIFTHNIFNITDQLSLTLGLRYTNESKDFDASFNNNNTVCPAQQAFFSPFLPGGATPLPATLQPLAAGPHQPDLPGQFVERAQRAQPVRRARSEDEWTGTGVLSWKPIDSLLLYASYSQGYKAGGFNLDRSALGSPIFAPTDPRQFGGRSAGFSTGEPPVRRRRTVNAYEIGFKYTRPPVHPERRRLPPGVQRLPAEHVQRHGLHRPEHQRLHDQPRRHRSGSSAARPAPAPPDDVDSGRASRPASRSRRRSTRRAICSSPPATPMPNTRYRNNLVGRDTGAPLDPALFLLPGDNLSNAPEHVVPRPRSPGRRTIGTSGLSRPVLCRSARLTGDYNTGSDLFPEKEQDGFARGQRPHRRPRAGPALVDRALGAEPVQPGLSAGRVQHAVPGLEQPWPRSRRRASARPSFATANQLFSSFLAEPRTYGITGRFRF